MFKERYRNHTSSFQHENKRHETELPIKARMDAQRQQQAFQPKVEYHQTMQTIQQLY